MTLQLPFQQVDVFTDTPFKGNPVAVVLEGDGLTTKEMQEIANWTNLSETTFVCQPTNPAADYKLRIFTPKSELPFAGHPTLGSAFAILKHGRKPKTAGRLVQESAVGLVDIRIEGEKLFFALPDPQIKAIDHEYVQQLANALGIAVDRVKASLTVDVGAVWMTLQLSDAEEVHHLRPNMEKLASLTPPGVTGVTVFGATTSNADPAFEVRSFAPSEGVPEDPVCGSGNGCVATVVRKLGLIHGSRYTAGQGYCVGRNGRVEVRFEPDGKILLGGNIVTCIEGQLRS
ncbi:PhzF family phenazine biosynthesis protein [Gracilibacillus alcaliphilus]